MKCRTTRGRTAVLFLLPLLLTPATARADYIYNWGPDIPTVLSDNSGMEANLSDEAQSAMVTGMQRVTAALLTTAIHDGVSGSDTFTDKRLGLAVDILDGTERGNVPFALSVNGSLSKDASALALGFPDGTTKEVTVNGHRYRVTLIEAGEVPGALSAEIAPLSDEPGPEPIPNPPPVVNPPVNTTGGPTTQNAPEPSTLVLAAVGAALVAGARRRARPSRARSAAE